MYKLSEQTILKIQEHQRLQCLELENNSIGKKCLMSFLSTSGETGYLRHALLPYVQKCMMHQKRQALVYIIASTMLCIFIVLLFIGIILAL